MILNPIIPGFNPDPSICEVEGYFYIATSTFEWYPGVQIHRSNDLQNWELVARPLNRPELLNLIGNPDSCGVWAPCLTHHDDKFYLIYTDVKRFDGNYKDTHNYLTCCDTVDGQWSDPVYLNSSGFDPSIYHADDGRKYICNLIWDHRSQEQCFGGIVLQEYSESKQCLVGTSKIIFSGSKLGRTEGPHIYFRNGYYYLITAEGGTSYDHAVTMARSKDIWGPYEIDPIQHIVTSKNDRDSPLQKAGHGDFVETELGDVYLVHLASRPLPNTSRCPLGRETVIQKMQWTEDGWLRKSGSSVAPDMEVDNGVDVSSPQPINKTYLFNRPELDRDFQWLRTPWPQEIMSLDERPGFLRLYGLESVGSWFKQSLVARRQQAFKCQATTRLTFSADTFQQAAGLISYYNTHKFHYLHVTHKEKVGMCIDIMSCEGDRDWFLTYPIESIPVDESKLKNEGVFLRMTIDDAQLLFEYSFDAGSWMTAGAELDLSLLSDDVGHGANFTGNFLGVACQDLSGRKNHADFEFFHYQEND